MKPLPFKTIAHRLEKDHTSASLVQGIAIDSRQVKPGDLFFALRGNRSNGHDFLEKAASMGAVGAVVDEAYRGNSYGLSLMSVPDVLEALQRLGRKSLQKRRSKVIAITGSLGKTTTKDWVATLLDGYYHVFASPLSYNSQVTVPLSILMADETEDILILEMGMSEPGQIENLVSIAPPDIALITTVALQHTSHFPEGVSAVAAEKGAIFAHPKTALGILNRDMPYFDPTFRKGCCPKKSFSMLSDDADYFLQIIEGGIRVDAKGEGSYEIPLNLPKFHYPNFLAAVAVVREMQLPWSIIQQMAPYLRLPQRRFERVEKERILFINDTYNANPDSMIAALENLPKPSLGGKTIAVLSEMDDLGVFSEKSHAAVAQRALLVADVLFCLGDRCKIMHSIWKEQKGTVKFFETRHELEKALKQIAEPGDVVLLKGARSYALEEILENYET
jgi:UDP-N-acetylmuramoyl-tripeptide--D-alanyl-D-alanine ligase